jgi:hypothetical protein
MLILKYCLAASAAHLYSRPISMHFTLRMETERFSETLISYSNTTRCHNPKKTLTWIFAATIGWTCRTHIRNYNCLQNFGCESQWREATWETYTCVMGGNKKIESQINRTRRCELPEFREHGDSRQFNDELNDYQMPRKFLAMLSATNREK